MPRQLRPGCRANPMPGRWSPEACSRALIVVVRVAYAPLTITDTYFHVRFGSEFLDGGSPPDPGSVNTFATADYVPDAAALQGRHGQGSDHFGSCRLVVWRGSGGPSRHALLSARRWCGPLLAASLACLAFLTSSQQLGMRPQLLSFLLVAVTTTAWLRNRDD
jgi:hypothetical protein